MAARPLASVLIESPGVTTVPVGLAMMDPLPCSTDAVAWTTVSVAVALVAACAELESQKSPAPMSRRITSRMMMRRYPPRRFGAGRAAFTDMAGTIPKGLTNVALLGSIGRGVEV